MKTKLEKYCDKFVNNNFDKRERKKDDSLKFEWFVNSMHAWHYSSQSYNSKSKIGKEISLGTSLGGDSFFIIINNQLFSLKDNLEEIIDLLKGKTEKIKVVFHIIQIKKSNKADLGDFKKFVEIPLKIFQGIGIDNTQPILVKLQSFIQKIIANEELKNIAHEFNLFFYTEKNENDIEKLKHDWKSEIEFFKKAYREYTDIKVEIRGSEFINNTYEKFISNDLILYVNKNNLKWINETEYLIGYLTAEELLNGIAPTDEEGTERILFPDVFKNNIRLYLGATPINNNIEKTLKEEPQKFHLYNNGLTITTKNIDSSNVNYYSISPVNIVNGCQTANSIYNVFRIKSNDERNVKIPVKIIVAQDEEYEKITIRTNSQNGLSEQDLVSITNIQKELEDYFLKSKIQNKVFYYKRQNSFELENIENVDFIVTINDILRASFSCLMFYPHRVSGYFDSTTARYINNIFEERFLKLYFILTVLLKITEEYIENNYPERSRLKFHIIYLFYKLINKDLLINEIEKYFRKKHTIDVLSIDEQENQTKAINKINSNIFDILKNETKFNKIIIYLLDVIQSEYPLLVDLNSKDKEKILYKTVDESQRGEKVFSNFNEKFTKSIDEIINS
ncbi:MAG: AIPR family protein [Ignavibacteria bacterium]|nr:AIPR family protein [Ignavibacteria bacterium]